MNKENENINSEASEGKGPRSFLFITAIVIFVLLTAGLGVVSFVVPDKDFSSAENRSLAKSPKLSAESVLDGSFMSELETYMADQFPFRDEAISLKTSFDRAVGKREENGVYIGKNGFLFDSQAELDYDDVKVKAELINGFAEKYRKTEQIVAIVPESSYFYKEYLPYGLALSDRSKQTEIIYSCLNAKNITALDTVTPLKELKNEGVQLFYKTDHHWTTEAAYKVFQSIADEWKLSDVAEYDFYAVTDSFEGTLSSKAGIHGTYDTVSVCIPRIEKESYIVNYETLGKKTTTLFFEEKLKEKNCYEVFLGGNYDKVSVETTAVNDKTLLIIKDSYANCMIPMFTPHFSQIVIVDPRYMSEGIDNVMSEYNVTHVLFLYNANTFIQDSTMLDVMSVTE